jgi:carbamoyltransferase
MASHNTGAALIAEGRIVAIAEERLNRVKYSENIFPERSIAYCLDALDIDAGDIGLVVTDWIGDREAETGTMAERFFHEKTGSRFTKARVVTINHHDAHAATAFFCSPFSEAAILVYDGHGDTFIDHRGVRVVETETMYRGDERTIIQLRKTTHARVENTFPYTRGIGKLYSFLSRYYIRLGSHNEGKMMGLAAYGDDRILRQFPLEKWIKNTRGELVANSNINYPRATTVTRRWSLLEMAKATYFWLRHLVRRAFIKRAVADHSIFQPIVLERPARDPDIDILPDKYYSSVAYAAQKIFEHFAIELGRDLRALTHAENLCVAGGCALNIDANRNFLTEVGFKDIFVQPASSDCGIALGCALWGWHVTLEQPRFWIMKSASLGRVYSSREIDESIVRVQDQIVSHVSNDVADEVAELVAEGNIIGWFQGGAEYGPRALGNRSIICDARSKDMRDVLNARVKHREMWRPFAVSVLAERLGDWFDLQPSSTTAFMLLAGEVREEKRALVPSIVHVDNTCRVQTLTKENNGVYYDLVKAFERKTATPLIINTSFNLGGEPIIESPQDALDTFLRTDMDYLVLGDRVIRRKS